MLSRFVILKMILDAFSAGCQRLTSLPWDIGAVVGSLAVNTYDESKVVLVSMIFLLMSLVVLN